MALIPIRSLAAFSENGRAGTVYKKYIATNIM